MEWAAIRLLLWDEVCSPGNSTRDRGPGVRELARRPRGQIGRRPGLSTARLRGDTKRLAAAAAHRGAACVANEAARLTQWRPCDCLSLSYNGSIGSADRPSVGFGVGSQAGRHHTNREPRSVGEKAFACSFRVE
jgi:hypothetical protein